MRLYLMRHGHAATAPGDAEPSLTEDGAEEVRLVAAFLAGRRHLPVEIHHSNRRRARETALLVAEALGDGVPVVESGGLAPHDPPEGLDALLSAIEGDLLVVSHLPFLDRLASRLVTGREGGGFDILPGGLLGLLRYPEHSAGRTIPPRFLLRFMVTPRLLGGLSG